MTDRLVDLAANPTARRWVSRLGLPIPLPQTLERMQGPRVERPLADRTVLVGGSGELTSQLASLLPRLGATVAPVDLDRAPFDQGGAAWSRPPVDEAERAAHALVFDATGLHTAASLDALYAFFHPRLERLQVPVPHHRHRRARPRREHRRVGMAEGSLEALALACAVAVGGEHEVLHSQELFGWSAHDTSTGAARPRPA